LLQESLAVATSTGAMKPSDLSRVVVDTTVQPKNVTFPTDAKLVNRAREKLVKLAKQLGIKLRQSYARVGKTELIQHQRYAHARQFKRAYQALRKLKTYLGRIIRDIKRKIADDDFLHTKFAWMLNLAGRVRDQERGQRGPKVYSLHAPEVECIGKGKPHKPYEFGVKVSVATTLKRCKGGQFAIHAQALPGNPYAPSHRVFVGRAEIGAAWSKRSNEGRDYLSVKLDDPSFTTPIYANHFDDEGGESFSLIWSRPQVKRRLTAAGNIAPPGAIRAGIFACSVIENRPWNR